MKKVNMKRTVSLYLIGFLLIHVVPLSDDLNLTANNSYIIESLRLDHLLHSVMCLPMFYVIFNSLTINYVSNRFVIALALGLVMAAFAESLQLLLPYRAFTIPDLIANIAGVVVGLLVFLSSRIFNIVKR
jgi:VanZ family protein